MKAAIYTRVSSEDQAREGYSLAAQLERLKAYCESQGWSIYDIYTDEGISAKNTERPELQRMLMDARHKAFDVILVYRLDRLTRNVGDLYNLLQVFDKSGVGFKSATEVFDTTNAMGRLFVTIIGALAQWERENMGERIKMGLNQKTRSGEWFNKSVPYGYRYVDKKLEIVENEAEHIRMLFAQYIGGIGIHRLANWMSEQTCNTWFHTRVYYSLTNPIYAGFMGIGKRDATANYEMVEAVNAEPIISIETFRQARAVANSRKGVPPRAGTGQYALVGIIKCGICGGAMVGYTTRKVRKNKPEYRYFGYKCLKAMRKKECNNRMFKMDELEHAVLGEVEERAQEALENARIETERGTSATERKRIEQAIKKIRDKRKRWMDAYEMGSIDAESLGVRIQALAAEESEAKRKLEALYVPSVDERIYEGILRDLRSSWDYAEIAERKELIRAAVERITVYPDGTVKVKLHR